jgi:hypothetical protein
VNFAHSATQAKRAALVAKINISELDEPTSGGNGSTTGADHRIGYSRGKSVKTAGRDQISKVAILKTGFTMTPRYHPTLREIGMKKCPVEFNESLYEAPDETGKPIATINESVHGSVIARYGAPAQLCSDDLNGTCSLAPYKPETLAPFYSSGVFAGLPIVD